MTGDWSGAEHREQRRPNEANEAATEAARKSRRQRKKAKELKAHEAAAKNKKQQLDMDLQLARLLETMPRSRNWKPRSVSTMHT